MSSDTLHSCPENAAVRALVPMAHVTDLERSVRFYALLGMPLRDAMRNAHGRMHWAAVGSGEASLMFALADGPVDSTQQAILFYLYSDDVAGLRTHLLASGLRDAGPFCGAPMNGAGRGAVSAISYPDYMPNGEIRIEDPDAYCLLVGQLHYGAAQE